MKNSYEHRPNDAVSQRIKDAMGIKRQKTYASPKPEGAVPAHNAHDLMRMPVWDGRVTDPMRVTL